jgi:transcriptional antiterminator RfaH
MAEQVGVKLSPILQQVALPARSSGPEQRLTFTPPVQLEAVSQPALPSGGNLTERPAVPATATSGYAAPVAHAASSVASTIIPITRTAQPTPDLDTTAWYLVYTKAQQEEIAQVNLERQGYECYLPKLRIEKMRRRKADIVEEPMFPRYLFVRLDLSGKGKSWTPIRSTLGVQQLIYFGSRAACVDDHLIEWLRQREQRHPTEPMFKAGEAVVVTDGPFAGIEAIYQTTNAERRAMILLEILSKPVTMQIDHARLRKTV